MKKLLILVAITIFNGCKVAGARQEPIKANGSVLNYFVSEQFASEIPEVSNALSSLFGMVMLAEESATFKNWSEPELGCLYTNNDQIGFAPKETVSIGAVILSGYSLNETRLEADPESQTFNAYGRLPSGTYNLSARDTPKVSFEQSFVVPETASSISIVRDDGFTSKIPSPQIPNSSDPGYTVSIRKSEGIRIRYSAPAQTDYIRVRISDGTSKSEGNITCYGHPNGEIRIPAGSMSYFRSTDDGQLFVDFVSVSMKTDQSQIKESFIMSYQRHFHGLKDLFMNDSKQTLRFGVLRFE